MTRVIRADRNLTAPLEGTPIIAAPKVADDFNRTNGPLGATSVGAAPWQQIVGTIQVIDGQAQATSVAGATGALWATNTTLAAGRFYLTTPTADSYLFVRGDAAGQGYLFGRSATNGVYRLSIRTSGTNTGIADTTAPALTGAEQLSVEVLAGGRMLCKVNGALVLDHTDPTYNGTHAGMRLLSVAHKADDFAAYAA